jgi:hypothetical protein
VPDGGAPGGAAHPGTGERDLGSLYQEIRRIREIAEARDAGEGSRRVAELTREVAELRATVARLRGAAMGGPLSGAHRHLRVRGAEHGEIDAT